MRTADLSPTATKAPTLTSVFSWSAGEYARSENRQPSPLALATTSRFTAP